jgi:Flp pilus assembly protein CpaB
MNGKRLAIGIAVLLALGVAGWFALQAGDSGSNGSAAADAARSGAPESWKTRLAQRGMARVEAGQVREPALTASHGPAESMPEAMRQKIRDNLNGVAPLHLRFQQAQHVRTPIGVGLWIVEGAGVACIFREGLPASSCRTSFDARREGIWLETYSTSKAHPGVPTGFLALGVVPEGVRAVSVTINGSRALLPVEGGVWAKRARVPIKIQRLVR